MPGTLIILRHAATKYDPPVAKKDRIAGWDDIPLAPEGQEEAKKIGKKLASQPIAKVWTSNLVRASETGRAVSKAHADKPIVMETKSLRPQNVGELTHKLEEDVRKDLLFYQTEAPTRQIPGGESFEAHTDRFLSFLGERFRSVAKSGKTEVIVTHSRNFPIIDGWMKAGMKGVVDKGPIKKPGELGVTGGLVFKKSGESWSRSKL